MRLSVLNDLLTYKKEKLKRYHIANKNTDLSDPVRQVVLRNAATAAANVQAQIKLKKQL